MTATPPAAFYVPSGDGFESTSATAGPWSCETQHGGPPSALLTTALARRAEAAGLIVARVTVELVRPVPVGPLFVDIDLRRGSRQATIDGRMFDAAGREVLLARGRAVRRSPAEVDGVSHDHPAPPLPEARPFGGMRGANMSGYLSAMEWRFPCGPATFDEPGPNTVWCRQRVPLVAGVKDTGLGRAMVAADSNWAVAFELDHETNFVINVDLGVTFSRDPVGEWIAMTSRTSAGKGRSAYAIGTMSDQQGPFGVATQTLLVSER